MIQCTLVSDDTRRRSRPANVIDRQIAEIFNDARLAESRRDRPLRVVPRMSEADRRACLARRDAVGDLLAEWVGGCE